MLTKCPNLVEWIDWVVLLCDKGKSPYVPDICELQKYCKTATYHKCPFYVNQSKNGAESSNGIKSEVTVNEYLHK